MLKINIRTDNAAFEEDEGATECARILRDIASKLERGVWMDSNRLIDFNGNTVGEWTFEPATVTA